MNYVEFLDQSDFSNPMTTARKHIELLCLLVAGKSLRILELGSHKGISAAAIALASPESTVTAVDKCDTVPESARVEFWSGLGITNITPVSEVAGVFLLKSQPGDFDLIFHDAVHGPAAYIEYLGCAEIAPIVAIHDWDQLPEVLREAVAKKFSRTETDADEKGRILFVGWR